MKKIRFLDGNDYATKRQFEALSKPDMVQKYLNMRNKLLAAFGIMLMLFAVVGVIHIFSTMSEHSEATKVLVEQCKDNQYHIGDALCHHLDKGKLIHGRILEGDSVYMICEEGIVTYVPG